MNTEWKQVLEDILNSLRGELDQEMSDLNTSSDAISNDQEESIDVKSTHSLDKSVLPPRNVIRLPQSEAITEAPPNLDSTNALVTVETSAQPAEDSSQQRHGRETAISLIGIVIVVAFIWIMSLGGPLSEPQPPAPDVVASFNGGQITIADIQNHLTLLVPDESQEILNSPYTIELIVQDMVTDELARQWATERQPDTDETFAHTMEHITEEINLEAFYTQLHNSTSIVTETEIQDYYYTNREQFGNQTLDVVGETIRQTLLADREEGYIEDYLQQLQDNASITRSFENLDVPAPTEDILRRYYDENIDQFTLPKQVIVDELEFPNRQDESTARQQADDALLSLRSGLMFDQLAQDNTDIIFTSAAVFTEGSRELEWESVVFELTQGEMSNAFRAGGSFYIVRLIAFEDERIQTFEETYELIFPIVKQQQTDIWFEENAERTLFTIKGRRYTLGQFYQEYKELSPVIQTQYLDFEGMSQLTEQIIERLLLVEDTYDQLLDSQNQPLTDETRLQVVKQMLHQENVDDQIQISDEEMQAFYDENRNIMALPPKARIRYIRVGLGSSDDEAQRARDKVNEAYNRLVPGILQTGEDFTTIAQEYSEDSETAANGGELPDWIEEGSDLLSEIELHPFHERVLTLQPGDISPIFEFDGSLYIVQVIERTEPEILTFEQAQPYIQDILFQQKHESLSQQLEKTLLEQADFIVYPSVLQSYLSQ